jgi:hypothetical protein
MGPEAKLQAMCRKYAREHGWWAAKFTSPGLAGVPDFIFIRARRVIFIEFKAPGKKPTPLQVHTMTQMGEHGANVAVCDDFEVFKELLA